MTARSEKELRCFCRSSPLLAIYGIDKDGELYVHQRVYKAQRLFGEIVVIPAVGTVIRLKCRNCFRWHSVRFRGTSAVLEEALPPDVESVSSE